MIEEIKEIILIVTLLTVGILTSLFIVWLAGVMF